MSNQLKWQKKKEIDSKKYMEFMESTLEQITSSMNLDFDTILGKPKQTGLDEFSGTSEQNGSGRDITYNSRSICRNF